MSFVDHAARELNLKIVYFGPGLGGKTSNLQYVYARTPPERRTAMVSRATEVERLLMFSLTPRSLPPVRGLGIRLHLYTVPGAVFYDASRRLVLTNVDGVVFVADSQRARIEANVESLEELESNLAAHGRDPSEVPLVVQYNKRDLPDVLPVAELDALLVMFACPRFEAVATTGVGVFDTLRGVTRAMLGPLYDAPPDGASPA